MTTTEKIERATPISSSAPFVELHFSFASRTQAISPSVDRLMKFIRFFIRDFGTAKEDENAIEIAAHEALANAVVHGNHENHRHQVHVTCRCGLDREVLITIRDDGEGFDSSAVPDPTASDRRLQAHGRGLHIMRTVMDEVSFEQNGTVVRLRKRVNGQTR
jgi:serine/threonine-protein kinase RsbW